MFDFQKDVLSFSKELLSDWGFLFQRLKGLLQIFYNIVDVLRSNGKTECLKFKVSFCSRKFSAYVVSSLSHFFALPRTFLYPLRAFPFPSNQKRFCFLKT